MDIYSKLSSASSKSFPQDHAPDTTEGADATTSPLQLRLDDREKLCEEGSLTHTSIEEYDYDYDYDKQDNDINNGMSMSIELKSPRRRSSISDYTKRCLPADTFSFLIYSSVQSRPFFLAAFVFLLQIAILVILFLDIFNLDNDNAKNPMDFPPNVEYPVRVSEVLAIMIAIITQEDIRKAVSLLRDGFDENLQKKFKGATFERWVLSIASRASEGLLGLFVTFLLIMRSSSVLDLLLNFLAVEFVTMLDDVVFALISEGFLGRLLKREATMVSNTCYHVSHRSVDSRAAMIVTVAYFVVLFTAFFAGWGVIFWQQKRGEYLCDHIFAQFGDEVVPMLGTFTGLFHRHSKQFGGRLSFRDDQDEGALLAYCLEEKRWTLSLTKDVLDPCNNWYAASSESVDFDVLATANTQWVVKPSPTTKRFLPLRQHFLACYVKLECESGDYGLRCEHPAPCQRLEIDPRDKGFVKTGGSYFASKYHRLEGAETYSHPVYTSLHDDETPDDGTDFIVFTGMRWILSSKYSFPGLTDITDRAGLVEYFSQFHGHFTNYSALYVSDPVLTDSTVDTTASPMSLRWRYTMNGGDQRLRPDLQKDFIDASFFCAECNNTTNPCYYGAVCQPDGSCEANCPNNASGTLCQIPPISNAQCDQYFNSIKFDFDGGDCCGHTCRSTHENTCGKADGGFIDTGYPWCKSAENEWQLSGDPVYGVSSASRSGLAVALSGKGTILAVADPGESIVRLFDKVGAEWIERGQVRGPPESDFGLAISLSDESFNIARNPLSSPIVTLAVGAPNFKTKSLGYGFVRIFKCSSIGCMQKGDDIFGSANGRIGSSLSIAKDGKSIAIGGGTDMESFSSAGSANANGEVKVYTWSKDKSWQQKGDGTIFTRALLKSEITELVEPGRGQQMPIVYMQQGHYVSLSGDYLALGTLEGDKIEASGTASKMNLITQVYKWGENGWMKLGNRIDKEFYFDESVRDQWPLKPVVIKGSILAIGSKSSVDVYSWNEAAWEWKPREMVLKDSEIDGLLGWSVDLSEDGSILAVGTDVENPQPNDESIRMYKWNGTHYRALFNGVAAGPASSVSLSSDGKAVAVGLPFDAWKGGSTRVYSFRPPSPCDDPSEVPLHISFTTDASPEETSWELQVDSQTRWISGSLSGHKYTTYVKDMCVPATSCVKFFVNDAQGDGLSRPGIFVLMLNGTEVARGSGNYGRHITKSIGNCTNS